MAVQGGSQRGRLHGTHGQDMVVKRAGNKALVMHAELAAASYYGFLFARKKHASFTSPNAENKTPFPVTMIFRIQTRVYDM
jgi:hypothetical protein